MIDHDSRPNPTGDAGSLDELERILCMTLESHQRLLALLRRKHDAIRRADLACIGDVCGEEERIVTRLRELERQRIETVNRFRIPPGAARPTITDLARSAEEPRRGRLLGLARELKKAVREVRRDSAVARTAAESLSRHLAGIMQVAQSALSRAGVYGRMGQIAAGDQVCSTLDLRS